MITKIGIVAGKILELLEERKAPVSISEIILALDESNDVVNMSIGWLIRDNYVRVIRGNEKYLSLMHHEDCPSNISGNVRIKLIKKEVKNNADKNYDSQGRERVKSESKKS